MTNEEAKKMLKAKLECLKNETSGTNYDCNMRLCDGCSLNYEQGNMGEQKEALEVAIKALEQQPSDDVISREAVIKHICESKECYKDECKGRLYKRCYDLQWIYDLPSVTPQPKIGKWIRCDILQEFKCSECRKCFRHKTNFCPYCGTKMESEVEE